jgi:putative protease
MVSIIYFPGSKAILYNSKVLFSDLENRNKNKIELLAPVGSFAALQAAIHAGADAVYFGIADFNMRATAAVNFTMENLAEVVDICHQANIKCYLTVNTLLYNEDLLTMQRIVDAAKANAVDAVIVADVATIQYARQVGIEVHISTQLSISNIEGVKFYAQFADRIVLARELSLEQVAEICRQIEEMKIVGPKGNLVEIEVFAHGALCVAVSGRCGMSVFCTGSSANRGKCSQICRRPYKVTDLLTNQEMVIDNNYVMSASDLSTIGMLDELVASGVRVLKIEGRGRGADYVDTVISTYRKALQAIEDGTYSEELIKDWQEDLAKVFNRGFTKGLFMGRSFDEWAGFSGNKSKEEKLLIGKVIKYYPKIEVVQIKIMADDTLKVGDEFGIIGDLTGIVRGQIIEMWVDDKTTQEAHKGEQVTFKISSKVKDKDDFYVFRKKKGL